MMMKGATAFILGIVIIIIVTVLFVLDKSVEYDKRVSIASSARHVYAAQLAAEEMKRTIDSAAGFSLLRQTSLGSEGGGFARWSAASPTMAELEEKFNDSVAGDMGRLSEITLFKNMTVSWDAADLSISHTDSDVTASGGKRFVIINAKNPRVTVETSGRFNRTVKTSYFGLLRAGRNLFENEDRALAASAADSLKGKLGEECKAMQRNATEFIKYSFQCGLGDRAGLAGLDFYDSEAANSAISDIREQMESVLASKYGYAFNISVTKDTLIRTDTVLVKLGIKVSIEDSKSISLYPGGFDSTRLEFLTNYDYELPRKAEVSSG
ncbi:MAG: hypothetical protein QXU82_01415 [Candidatus Aenigmatarchaeota archaeon]